MKNPFAPWILVLSLATMLVVANSYTANLVSQGAVNPTYVSLVEILIKLGVIKADKADLARDIVNERVKVDPFTFAIITPASTSTLVVATSTATTTDVVVATTTATTTSEEIGGTQEQEVVTPVAPRRRTTSGQSITAVSLALSTTSTSYNSFVYATTTVTGGGTLTYSYTDTNGGLQATSSSNTYSHQFTATGTQTITVNVLNNGTFATTTSANVTINSIVPGAPTIGTAATNTPAQAYVPYTAPASNGGSAITSYTVTSNPGSISTTTSSTTGAVVTGLTNGTAYTFTVLATNAVGNSASSSASNSVTPVAAGNVCGSGDTANMLAYWRFEEGTGSSVADVYGSNEGTLFETYTWGAGKVGNAISFDRSDWNAGGGYVDVGGGISGVLTEVTVVAWAKVHSAINTHGFLIARDRWDATGGFAIAYNGSNLYSFGTNSEQMNSATSPNVHDGSWHFVATVFKGSQYMRTYIDDALSAEDNSIALTQFEATAQPIIIGRQNDNDNDYYFDGLIDEVAIFDRALTTPELLNLYNTSNGGAAYCN